MATYILQGDNSSKITLGDGSGSLLTADSPSSGGGGGAASTAVTSQPTAKILLVNDVL